jgi:hypothetical protein
MVIRDDGILSHHYTVSQPRRPWPDCGENKQCFLWQMIQTVGVVFSGVEERTYVFCYRSVN